MVEIPGISPIPQERDGGSMICLFCGFSIPVFSVDSIPDHCPKCRDEFAKAALTAMLSCAGIEMGASWADGRAADAYKLADAMLEARKLKEKK